MKYSLLYLTLAGFMFFACNQNGEEASTDEGATETEQTNELSTDLIDNANTGAEEAEVVAEPVGGDAKMEFETYDYDFGQIQQGEKVEHVFKFTNTGTEDLIISEAKGTCGCTVPSWPKEPIAPGESGEIQVAYDSKGKKGVQRKSVNITANTTPNRTTINITSEVLVPEDAEESVEVPAPAN